MSTNIYDIRIMELYKFENNAKYRINITIALFRDGLNSLDNQSLVNNEMTIDAHKIFGKV